MSHSLTHCLTINVLFERRNISNDDKTCTTNNWARSVAAGQVGVRGALLKEAKRSPMGCAGSKKARPQNLGTPGAPPTPVAQAQQSKQARGTLTRELPPHFGPEALLASVESGAIAPLRGSWVVALHERGGKLQRRQDLPPEAFFTATELRELVAKLGDDYGLLFVALSYRCMPLEALSLHTLPLQPTSTLLTPSGSSSSAGG